MEMEIIQSKNLKLLEKLIEIKFINVFLFLSTNVPQSVLSSNTFVIFKYIVEFLLLLN